jgi:ABC-type multidrug transport system fused ATPase/permease subunit
MTRLEELKLKRKASLIVVCTLGLAAIFASSIRPVWMTNIFENTSLNKDGLGFVLKCFSYILLALFTAAIMFVIHFFKLIYYQIEITKLTP